MIRRDSTYRARTGGTGGGAGFCASYAPRSALSLLALAAAGSLGSAALVACKKQSHGAGAESAPQASASAPDPAHNLVKNATFSDGSSLPWLTSWSEPAHGESGLKDGALCLTLEDKGKNPWDAQLVHRPVAMEQGHSYTLDFRAWASKDTMIRPKVGMSGPPYTEYWNSPLPVGPQPQRFQSTFVMGSPSDPTAEFSFFMAGPWAKVVPVTVCIDDQQLGLSPHVLHVLRCFGT